MTRHFWQSVRALGLGLGHAGLDESDLARDELTLRSGLLKGFGPPGQIVEDATYANQ